MNAPVRHTDLFAEPQLARVSGVPVAFCIRGRWMAFYHVYEPGHINQYAGVRA